MKVLPLLFFCYVATAALLVRSLDLAGHFLAYQSDELVLRHRASVALALRADLHHALGLLLLAHDQQERNASQLVVADLAADLLVAVVDRSTNIGII